MKSIISHAVNTSANLDSNKAWRNIAVLLAFTAVHGFAFADFDAAAAESMLGAILTWVKSISVGIVTIAFIFAGYQIAFGGKRFNDVLPIVIGAIIIGAAAQLAGMAVTQ
jgi:type IV secretion system protein VirB2